MRLIDADALLASARQNFNTDNITNVTLLKLFTDLVEQAPTCSDDCLHCKQYDDGYLYGWNIGYNKAKAEFNRPAAGGADLRKGDINES